MEISDLSNDTSREISDVSSILHVGIATNTQSITSLSTGFSNGQLLIGKTDGTLQKATLTDGSGIDIENNNGEIIIKTAFKVKGTKLGETSDVTHSNINFLTFDKDSGFTVQSDNSGEATIGLGSHWKQLDFAADGGSVTGTSLIPSGEETLKFVAGNHIAFTSDPSSNPQSIKIEASIDSSLNEIKSSVSNNSTNIVDLSNDTTTIINTRVTDLSGYTSSELNREISDLRSETVKDISDLSSTIFTSIIGDINTLSTSVSDDIRDLSSTIFTSIIGDINTLSTNITQNISDLSNYTSSELSIQIAAANSSLNSDVSDLSSIAFNTISVEISDLSSDTSREISVVKALTSSDITDLSSIACNTISIAISDLSSDT